MTDKTVRAFLFTGITVLISTVLLVTLFCLGPHNKEGFGEHHTHWSYVPLIQDPYTFNENGPYMSSYNVTVDTDNRCVALGFLIEGDEEIKYPDEAITINFNGTPYRVYRAPFIHTSEYSDGIESYQNQVKDGSFVYTCRNGSCGMALYVYCPMEGIFKDPADLNTLTVGFLDIYDVDGNCITTDEAHSDWVFSADRDRKSVSYNDLIDVDAGELRNVSVGDDARIIISPNCNNVEFCDIDEDSPAFNSIEKGFSIDGFDADISWSKEQDDNGEERLIITVSNIRNIIGDSASIHIPAGLAHAWKDGTHRTSGRIDRKFTIVNAVHSDRDDNRNEGNGDGNIGEKADENINDDDNKDADKNSDDDIRENTNENVDENVKEDIDENTDDNINKHKSDEDNKYDSGSGSRKKDSVNETEGSYEYRKA